MSGSQAPIGVFDSGVGGLSVWREIRQQLPNEDTIYLADQAHIPYGGRTLTEVKAYAEGVTRFLINLGAKAIVVACNTASGAALHALRATFPDIPFIGMEPALKPAVEHTRRGVVGVLATPTTYEGDLFRKLAERFASHVELHTQTCPGLVEAVENGAFDSPATRKLLEHCLNPLKEAGIDQLVLGCTHYPFLIPAIRRIVDDSVAVIDPGPAVARQVRRVLEQRAMLTSRPDEGRHAFYTSADPVRLAAMLDRLISGRFPVQQALWVGADEAMRLTLPGRERADKV